MNDNELDEMLNQWGTPPVRTEFRKNVRTGFAAMKTPPRRWFSWPSWEGGKGLFAGLAAGAVVFLVVISQAFPQALNLSSSSPMERFPYFVNSNVVAYANDGSSRLDATLVSYSYKGSEIVLMETHPGNPAQEFFKSVHIGIHNVLLRYVPGLVMPESAAKDAWFNSYVQSGCVDKGDIVVGHETILKHATTAVQQNDPDGSRWTAWRAPDLGCFAMRTRSEVPLTGGGYRVTRQRDATLVAYRTGHPWQIQAQAP